MKEGKSIFLKVDSVEPVLKGGGICSRETYLDGVKVWIGNYGYFFPCDRYTVCDPDAVREDGRRQVVALAKELTDMKIADKDKLFGYHTVTEIVTQFSYDEVTEKLDDWKKEKETIRVRDEVVNTNNSRTKFVVTDPPYMASNSLYYFSGIGKDGKVYRNEPVDRYKKTGVHVDNIDAYLEV